MPERIDDLAAKLAEDVIEVQDATGEDRLFVEVGDVIGASSQTLEEAFLTQVRIRMAEILTQRCVGGPLVEFVEPVDELIEAVTEPTTPVRCHASAVFEHAVRPRILEFHKRVGIRLGISHHKIGSVRA